jgi:hypothetical protein
MGKYNMFECYGHFYKLKKGNIVFSKCRSLLEIINTNQLSFEELKHSFPDALCIMMNPGTSTPKDSSYKEKVYDVNSTSMNHRDKELVFTIPDDTQYRIMAVMKEKDWKYVRVINLSDIRQHQSEKLKSELNMFNRIHKIPIHSIFIKERKYELSQILSSVKSKPIIFAWGTERCLKEYAKVCIQNTTRFNCFGIRSRQDKYFLQHPLTTSCSWVEDILDMLNGNNTLDF